MLTRLSLSHNLPPVGVLHAVDYMDEGSKIELKITIDRSGPQSDSLDSCDFFCELSVWAHVGFEILLCRNQRTAVFDFTGTDFEICGKLV